jgi:exopolysaccharide production protein ExoZ
MMPSIQYLRGIAAMMVVYHHIAWQILKTNTHFDLPFSAVGAAGVDVFFVISGFVMWICSRSSTLTAREFLRRRIVRIVPLYWAVTLFLLAVSFIAPQILGATTFNPLHALLSLFFIPVEHPQIQGDILPFFVQGWTLNYEMFFYVIFAFSIFLFRKTMFTTIVTALVILAASGLIFSFENTIATFYARTIVLEFAFGVALGHLFLSGVQISRLLAGLLVAGGIIGIAVSGFLDVGYGPNGANPWRALIWGLPSLAIVAGAVFLEMAPRHLRRSETSDNVIMLDFRARGKKRVGALLRSGRRKFQKREAVVLQIKRNKKKAEQNNTSQKQTFLKRALWEIGQSSYSLYLTHIITLPAVSLIWRWSGIAFSGFGGVAFVMTAALASIACGLISHYSFEKPVIALLNKKKPARTHAILPTERKYNVVD